MGIPKEKLLASTPVLAKGLDFSKTNLTPKEAFLLSRIDGKMKIADISKISSMNVDDTISSFITLASKEVISFKEFGLDQLKNASTSDAPTSAPTPAPPVANKTAPDPVAQKAAQAAAPPTPSASPQPPQAAQAGPRLAQPLYKRPDVNEDLSDVFLKGSFNETTFPELLAKLFLEKQTGILRVTRRKGLGHKELFLRSGVPVYVGGTYAIEKECLGQLLRIAGKITNHDLARSLELVKQGKMQGQALIELGIINNKMLAGSLKWQMELKVAEIFTWREGEGTFEFYRTGKFGRDFIPSPVPLGALILKGVKRGFPYSIVKSKIDPHLNSFVVKKLGGDFDPATFNFQLPEQRLFEKVIDGSRTVKQIIEESQMDPQMVAQFLYALYATQLVDMRSKPGTGTNEDKIIDDLKARLSLSQKGDFFDCLGIHWSSIGWKVQEGWEKIQRLYGPQSKYQKDGTPEMAALAKNIYDLGKKAYEALIDDQRRVAYRKELFNETKLQISSDLQYQQAESQLLWKEDYRSALEILESAAELAPTNWIIQAAYGCALIKRHYPNDSEKVRKGESVVQRALNAASKNDVVHFFAGHAYLGMKRTNQAKSEFETAVRLNPNNRDAMKALRAMARASS